MVFLFVRLFAEKTTHIMEKLLKGVVMENETVDTAVSMWKKSFDDLTVGESVIAMGTMTAAVIAGPIAVMGVAVGVAAGIDKIRKIRNGVKNAKLEVIEATEVTS